MFEEILSSIDDRPRFITLRSRGAERAVLDGLRRHKIRGAVFLLFTGARKEISSIIDDGHFHKRRDALQC